MRVLKPFTEEEVEFIKSNYPNMTMVEIARELKTYAPKVQDFIKNNGLSIGTSEAQKLRFRKMNNFKSTEEKTKKELKKPMDKPKVNWVSDPWNKKLNLVTMYRVNLKY